MTLRIGSLFSGAGALDLAAEHVFGAQTVWHSEVDPHASRVLAHHWPNVPNHGDITQIDWAAVEPIDILTGGWPCQPWSVAGKRQGENDERALWPYVAAAVRALRPRYVVLENVSNIIRLGELARAVGDLAAAGYDAQWTCIRASEIGAPHHRARVFILATPAYPDCERRGQGAGQPSAGGQELTPAIGGVATLPTPRASRGASATETVALLPTPVASNPNDGEDPEGWLARQAATKARVGNGNGMGMPLGIAVALLPTPNASDGSGGGQPPAKREGHSHQIIDAVLSPQWGKYTPAIRRLEQITRTAPAPTELNSNGKPHLAAPFAEWMMGWPAGWVTASELNLPRTAQLKIVGNGVVTLQAIAALWRLLDMEAM